jgi:hypothetical protein
MPASDTWDQLNLHNIWQYNSLRRWETFINIECVPLTTEPSISLIILPLMRILQRNLKRTYTYTNTHEQQPYCVGTLSQMTEKSAERRIRQETGWLAGRPLLRVATIRRTTDTSLFISHTTNVPLFKLRCNIFIGVRIIKEMPGSVVSGTHCVYFWLYLAVFLLVVVINCLFPF